MNVIDLAGYILGGAGIIGFTGAALYTGRAKAVITLQQDEITALRESQQRLYQDNKQLTSQVAQDKSEISRLGDQVKSVPAFEKMSIQMAKQHKEVITTLGQVATELSKVAQTIAASANDNNRREANGK